MGDANDLEMLARAFRTFLSTRDRPTLIILDSHIAYGAPNKQDTSAAHGEPLGEQEVRLAKRHYGWPEDATFHVPDGVYEHFQSGIGKRGKELRDGRMHGSLLRRDFARLHYAASRMISRFPDPVKRAAFGPPAHAMSSGARAGSAVQNVGNAARGEWKKEKSR